MGSYFSIAYVATSIGTALADFLQGDWRVGLACLGGSALAWYAGSGLKGTFVNGGVAVGLVIAFVLLCGSLWLLAWTNIHFVLLGPKVPFWLWSFVGVAAGWAVLSTRELETGQNEF